MMEGWPLFLTSLLREIPIGTKPDKP
jgi:hypothetical protein